MEIYFIKDTKSQKVSVHRSQQNNQSFFLNPS